MEETIAPGAVLARRYRLDEQLTDRDGAQAWRAYDTVLGRTVAVHMLPVGDPRAERVAEAARSAAALHDPRFLRVLDAAIYGHSVYVIREWVRGRSLATLVAQAPLSPTSAGVLAREVAEAVDAAHAIDLCHLRLDPDTVLVGEDGAVKVTGLGTEAVLRGVECDDAAVEDARGIGKILYAALTGRWPGTDSRLPPAPVVDGRLARPRQVRAGVPRELDEVVDRVLGDPPRSGRRLRTPRQVAEALAAVVPAPGRGLPYLLDLDRDTDPERDSVATQPGTGAVPPEVLTAAAARPATPAATTSDTPPVAPPARRISRPARPASPRRPGERRMSRVVGAVAGGLLLIGSALVGWQLLTTAFPGIAPGSEDPRTPVASSPGTSGSPGARGPLRIVAADDFDPAGDPPEENPGRVGQAIDGDPATTWSTVTYFDPIDRLKPGVGLYVDLGSAQPVRSVRLSLVGSGAAAEVRVAPEDAAAPPDALDGWRQVAARADLDQTATVDLGQSVTTRYVLLWFTALPPVGADYKLEVAEVQVGS